MFRRLPSAEGRVCALPNSGRFVLPRSLDYGRSPARVGIQGRHWGGGNGRPSGDAAGRGPNLGVFPIAPTPFTEAGELDPSGMRRVLDCMVDQGVDGICILANYSEQFLLSDEERNALLDVCLTHVAGRVPVIVTCSHFSTRIAVTRAKRAAEAGAQMLMLMPPYHGAALRADETGMFEHFARVAAATRIPIMVQDAPLSGVNLSVPFLARLARELPQVRYFKIEVPGAAAKLRSLVEAGGDAIEGPFDGEESITLMADLDAGATGTMPSALLPDLIKPVLGTTAPDGAPRRRRPTTASCRSSITRTANAACAPPRRSWLQAVSSRATRCAIRSKRFTRRRAQGCWNWHASCESARARSE